MSETVVTGNAARGNEDQRGWFVGHFIQPDDLRHSGNVEIKWGQHDEGESREEWTLDEQRLTVCILVAGRFRLEFSDGSDSVLAEQGDYAMWGPGTSHRWQTLADGTTTMTVRWFPESVPAAPEQ